MSPTIKSEKITQQAYNLVYAEMEEMCMNYAGHLNFWHVLEVLIVNRLGFDALPVSKESPDRPAKKQWGSLVSNKPKKCRVPHWCLS